MTRRVVLSLLGLLLVGVGASVARADRIAIESYVGPRSRDADRVAPLVRSVFERRGFITQPAELGKVLRVHRSRVFHSGPISLKFAQDLQKVTDEAGNDYVNEEFDRTAKILGDLIAEIRLNPLAIARNPKHRALAFQALLLYALASGRQAAAALDEYHAAEAKHQTVLATQAKEKVTRAAVRRDDAITELIRSFPSKVLTSKEGGHEAELMYQRTRGEIDSVGRGSLAIAVNDPEATIYCNEIVQGTQKATVGNLVPGINRVLVQLATEEALEYEIDIPANGEVKLDIDWDLDSMLVVGDGVGIAYPTEKEHAREAALMRRLARQHTSGSTAVTYTVTRLHGHVAVVGTSYTTTRGTLLFSSAAELTGSGKADEAAIDHLADCITGVGHPDEPCVVVEHPEYTPPPEQPSERPPVPPRPPPRVEAPAREARSAPTAETGGSNTDTARVGARGSRYWESSRWIPVSLSGGGLVALGATLYRVSRPNTSLRATLDGKWIGIDIAVAGSVVAGGGVYLFLRQQYQVDHLTSACVGGSIAMLSAAAIYYLVDENPIPSAPPIVRNTMPAAIALGAGGAVLAGAGLWLWHRDRGWSWAPVASIQRGGGTIGWTGQF